jgi:hypothetical protein
VFAACPLAAAFFLQCLVPRLCQAWTGWSRDWGQQAHRHARWADFLLVKSESLLKWQRAQQQQCSSGMPWGVLALGWVALEQYNCAVSGTQIWSSASPPLGLLACPVAHWVQAADSSFMMHPLTLLCSSAVVASLSSTFQGVPPRDWRRRQVCVGPLHQPLPPAVWACTWLLPVHPPRQQGGRPQLQGLLRRAQRQGAGQGQGGRGARSGSCSSRGELGVGVRGGARICVCIEQMYCC